MRLFISTIIFLTQLSVLILVFCSTVLANTNFSEAVTSKILSDFQLEDISEDTFIDKIFKNYISKIKVVEMSSDKSFTYSDLKNHYSRFVISSIPYKFHPRENTAGR